MADLAASPLVFSDHQRSINDLAFSSDGRWLATASRDQTVRLWSLDAPHAAPQVLEHEAIVDSVTFAPDSNSLLSGTENGVILQWLVSATGLAKVACSVTGRSFLPVELEQYVVIFQSFTAPCSE
jgi:WD40 repeat protein